MQQLHAYWRMDYIEAPRYPAEMTRPFTELPALGDDRAALIVHRSPHSYLVLNRFPYNPGHLLAVPFREVGRNLEELSSAERADLMEEIVVGKRLLTAALKPDAFNVGFNLGAISGGSIAHLHAHLVPRWSGDNNFMPVIGQTRILPQSLEATWAKAAAAARGQNGRPLFELMPSKTLHFPSPRHLSQLYAERQENLVHAEQALSVKLVTREDWLKIEAAAGPLAVAEEFFGFLHTARTQGMAIRTPDFERLADSFARGEGGRLRALLDEPLVITTSRRSIVPKTLAQKLYLQSILKQPVVFGIGPAGTGKTYLAMAAAVAALQRNEVQRIILTRPAVEAGEALGFLPGDLREKILPYLRPLYDALHEMIGPEDATRLTEKGVIEIAPLAYMRGRTLAQAFIVLDEAQNTTPEQMMMFLTRLGEDARMVITGDVTQIDLPRSKQSGLLEAREVLREVPGIDFHVFSSSDVVRHPLVQRIIDAYEQVPQSDVGPEELPLFLPHVMSVRHQLKLLAGGIGAHRRAPP